MMVIITWWMTQMMVSPVSLSRPRHLASETVAAPSRLRAGAGASGGCIRERRAPCAWALARAPSPLAALRCVARASELARSEGML
eukprot:5609578-Prymnesium_polylepis.1